MADEDDGPLFASGKGRSTFQDRIAAFEMLDRMGDATQAQKNVGLALCGFERQDIAAMQQITLAVVRSNI